MKRRFFSILVFSVLFLCVLNLRGDIRYTSNNPVLGVTNSSFTKWVDIPTGEESWGRTWGNTVEIVVAAGMEGVGEGQGTLTNINIFGGETAVYQDGVDYAGTTDPDGSYTPGTGTAQAVFPEPLPENAKDGDSWSWSAGGSTTIWPLEWHRTTALGVQVNIPGGVAGRYTTAGGWEDGTTITRSPRITNDTYRRITLNVDYKCSACGEYGDTASDVCAGSDDIVCSRSCGCEGESADSGYGCSESDYYDWCNDAGTCSVGSGYGVPGPQCGHNYCCCDINDSGDSDDDSISGSLSGPYSALAGQSVTIGLSTNTAFSEVYWYVAGPGVSGLGSHIETDTGGSSSTTESFTYTFGSSDSGSYTITAFIYNYTDPSSYDVPSTYELSRTISVSDSYSGSDSGSGNGSGNGSGGSTAPSNSGSGSGYSGSTAPSNSGSGSGSDSSDPGCSNNPDYNYCTDDGTCSEGSGSGVPGPICGHNYCCCYHYQ